MGHLQDGVWTNEEFLTEHDGNGTYVKQPSQFRNWVTADGSAGPTGTYVSGVRELNLPLASGNFTLDAGSTITMRMFYRSVEDGTYCDVVPMPASASDGEGGTIPGAWSNDCRCTLYIDLQ